MVADIYRPAAMEQLRVLGEQIGIDVYIEAENKDAVSICAKMQWKKPEQE